MQDSTLNKLILLFIFDKIEIPITEETLLDLCSSDNDWLNYMDCKQTLSQLVEAGFVFCSNSQSGMVYSITPDGRICLAHYYLRIPISLRDDIAEYTKQHRLQYRKKQEYFRDYYKNSDGTYTVCLKIFEPNQTVMDLKLVVQDRHKAKWIYNNWEENAPQVYATLYSILAE